MHASESGSRVGLTVGAAAASICDRLRAAEAPIDDIIGSCAPRSLDLPDCPDTPGLSATAAARMATNVHPRADNAGAIPPPHLFWVSQGLGEGCLRRLYPSHLSSVNR